ncbi:MULTISPECIES: hypothetical protein [Actinomadura]|uniref:Uncharacterized protein n=1 Tax=Actinomadura yumaensis TaxID=111807 RepID=A0ABW2CTC5_9ACTN|nr:hypothetical protein [Actinomadura sp. J1-007]MWK34079.1 hypothetical protein [Actinomadura sp. J1-007]
MLDKVQSRTAMAVSAALLALAVPQVQAVSALGAATVRDQETGAPAAPWQRPSGRTTLPPWPAPKDARPGMRAAGLPLLSEDAKLAQHIHAHLDVIVNGKPVVVPADIGIDRKRHGVSPLHTHDTTGVLHIESTKKEDFYLGQFFNEWQVSFSRKNLGGLRTSRTRVLKVHVNGALYKGDPRNLKLRAHDQIAVVYGKARSRVKVPGHYEFPPGA